MTEISDLELLDLYRLSGVTEVIADAPADRFAQAQKSAETMQFNAALPPQHTPAAPVYAAQASPAPQTAFAPVTAATLDELKAALQNFEGCALKKTARNLVFGTGNATRPDVMIIGEAPGEQEDLQGLPFVGASGRLLDQMLASIGLSREQSVYIANVVPWRPPVNRKPSEDEIAACLPFLRRHIALVAPKILLLLGGISLSAVLNVTTGITRARGVWHTYEQDGLFIPVMASFHPAYLLRSPAQKKNAWHDLLCVRGKLDSLQ